MASGTAKLHRMMRTESKKSHSWWWDSHVSPKNSRWLQENLEEMDQLVKRMLKLIEEDADSFAKKVELYFKKRPDLLSLVEEFYRMYRSLAERYDHVTGELRKSIPSDLQSQGSGISDTGSEPPSANASPDPNHPKPGRTKSGPRAAGFDFFLGNGGSGSDLNSKGDDASTLDSESESESESDDSSVNTYSQSHEEEQSLRKRVLELENELMEVKDNFQVQKETENKESLHESSEVGVKLATYEDELEVAKEKIRISSEEITRLTKELQQYKSLGDLDIVHPEGVVKQNSTAGEQNYDLNTVHSEGVVKQNGTDTEQNDIQELQAHNGVPEEGLVSSHKIQTLEEELRIMSEKLQRSEKEVSSLRLELTSKDALILNSQDQLKSAQIDVAAFKTQLVREKWGVVKLQDRILRYKGNLSERDQEIRELREAISDANKSLSEENEQLKADMTRIRKEKTYLEDDIKGLNFRCQSLEEDLRRVKSARDEMQVELEERGKLLDELKLSYDNLMAAKDELNAKFATLGAKMSSKDDEIDHMRSHLNQLHLQHVVLITKAEEAGNLANELKSRVIELETEVERKHEVIVERAEEKREAIRQLCFSLEHYRNGYRELRQAIHAHRRPPVTAR